MVYRPVWIGQNMMIWFPWFYRYSIFANNGSNDRRLRFNLRLTSPFCYRQHTVSGRSTQRACRREACLPPYVPAMQWLPYFTTPRGSASVPYLHSGVIPAYRAHVSARKRNADATHHNIKYRKRTLHTVRLLTCLPHIVCINVRRASVWRIVWRTHIACAHTMMTMAT